MADETGKPKRALNLPIGDSGLRAYGGFVNDEFLRELSGERGRRVYREMMDNDATVGAIIEGFTALICGVDRTVTAADETPAAEEAKTFVEECLDDMSTPMEDVLTEICTMFGYGFAPMEMTWKQRRGFNVSEKRERSKFEDGKWGISEIALRSQTSLSRWEINPENGDLLGMWQQATWKHQVLIPIERLALFRTVSVKNSPEGKSILRRVYRSWYLKSKIEELEAIGVERDLAGVPIGRLPSEYFDPNAPPEFKVVADAMKRMVTQMRRESKEGIVLPSEVFESQTGGSTGVRKIDLQLLTSGGTRQFDTSGIIDRYDRKMATAVLMDFLFLGQQSVGSFALSSDKTALFAQALGAYLKRIFRVINDVIIGSIWELNAFDPKLKPTVTPGDLESPDLMELSSFLSTLIGAGMMLDRETENYLRKAAGLPLAPEEGLDDQGVPMDEPEPEPEPLPVKVVGIDGGKKKPAAGAKTKEPVTKVRLRESLARLKAMFPEAA